MILGIDPGKAGGLAALRADGTIADLRPVPLIDPGASRPEYDLSSIIAWLECAREGGTRLAVVERLDMLPAVVRGKPMGGGHANFARGESRGWVWALAALRIPCQLVLPRVWQRAMLAGTPAGADTKARSIVAAQRLFPAANLLATPRSRKPHDGMADALLLAEYGRRVLTATAAAAAFSQASA